MAKTFDSNVLSWAAEKVLQNPVFDQKKLDKKWKDKFPSEQLTSLKRYFDSALPGRHVDEIVYKEIEKLGITK